MTGTDLVPLSIDAELSALARRHRAAGGVGMQLLNILGGQAENLLERLPDKVKERLETATSR
ncbi:MAG TPA: protein EcsC, partial [Citreicella sp.]|nr:protein EcsC [Citreicella sp.]